MAGSEISLEGVVRGVVSEGCFSHNGVSFSLDDYFDGDVLNSDWVYFLARDVENNRKRLRVSLDERYNVNPRRLYKAISDSDLKKETNRPSLPHEAYFEMVRLIEQNPEKYQFDEGYIQLARDLRDDANPEFKANLGHVWSGAKQYREGLNWTGQISLPLDAFDKIDELIDGDDSGKYVGDEGYIQLARDLRHEGFKANLGHVWSGAKQYREGLNWTGVINLPLDAFDKIDELIKEDCGKYVGDEGYIQLARDLRDATGFKANLGDVWSGAKEHRAGLNWTGIINLPLDAFDKIDELIKEDCGKYVGDEGYIQLARDLRREGFKANLGDVWSGAKEHREGLNWTGIINLPLDAFDKIDELIKESRVRYRFDDGYVRLAQDLSDEGFSVNLRYIWAGAKEHRLGLGWSGVISGPLDAVLKDRDASVKAKEENNDSVAVSGKNGRQGLITDAINEEYLQILNSEYATAGEVLGQERI